MSQRPKKTNLITLFKRALSAFGISFLFSTVGWAATPLGSIINNTAQVTFTVGGIPGFTQASNNHQITTVAYENQADLNADFSKTSLSAGDSTTLNINITNMGNNNLTQGAVSIILLENSENNISGILAMKGNLKITESGNRYVVDLPDIAIGSTASVSITTTVSLEQGEGSLPVSILYFANDKEIASVDKSLAIKLRTSASVETLYYDSTESATPTPISITQYDKGDGTFANIPAPTLPGTTTPVTDAPLSLIAAREFHMGQTFFIRLTDGDQNIDPSQQDFINLSIVSIGSKDQEIIRLIETGIDTGIFSGYLPTRNVATVTHDGMLSVGINDEVQIVYTDSVDNSDTKTLNTLIDPFGIVFDSDTGGAVSGVTVSLINTASGLPAQVFGDDGLSSYPPTVVTGETIIDGSGTVYTYPEGRYRFPLVAPGSYQLIISLPKNSGYSAPSTVETAVLQALPGGPFAIDVGSRGEIFQVNPGPPVHLDLPIDPIGTVLFVRKEASKDRVANGDFLQYKVSVENTTTLMTINNIVAIDRLPHGFRYAKDSTSIAGLKTTNPPTAADGRTLSFPLGTLAPGEMKEITYVAAVATAHTGMAVNQAHALGNTTQTSNTAKASVLVIEDLMRSHSILMGQVLIDVPEKAKEADLEKNTGLEGIRITLENGSYTVTDKHGRYHFEGLKPGTHVVQLDLDSLPEGYEIKSHEQTSRGAGRAWSRFVDLQGGTMWREDFHVALKGPQIGKVSLRLAKTPEPDGSSQELSIHLKNRMVPLGKVRLMVMLPENTTYLSESATLDGEALQDPEILENVLVFRLSDLGAQADHALNIRVGLPENAQASDFSAKAVLLFDTPAKIGEKSPVVSSVPEGSPADTEVTVETQGLGPGENARLKNQEPGEASEPLLEFDKIWFEDVAPELYGLWLHSDQMPPTCDSGANPSDTIGWLWPGSGFQPKQPSQKIVIKHGLGDQVMLTINGEVVNDFYFEGTATIKTTDTVMKISRWKAIPLLEGDNYFRARVTNADGIEQDLLECSVHFASPPASAIFMEEESSLIADGITPPVIVLRLMDGTGIHPAREDGQGEFSVAEPYRALRETDHRLEVMPGAPKEATKYLIQKDGRVRIRLEPTTHTGEVKLTFPFSKGTQEVKVRLVPDKRDWILVGFAEGTLGYNTLSGNMEALAGQAAEDKFYSEGQVKFYAKGQVKGEWLLTLAYDSEKEKKDNSLFDTIDPGTFYTLYGDTSAQRYDAASNEKLYLKLERDHFYALFGDFDTNLTVTELSRYQRSLTGLKSELFGDKAQFNLFISESNQAYAKESIRAQGISGPYRLTRKNIVMNSEKITIETRDRFRSEVVVSAETPSRHLDYDIDYNEGTLTFREALFSTDSALNPTYIVVEYESFDDIDRSASYGGRAAIKPLENVELGLSHINEGKVGGKSHLEGVDMHYDITPETRLRGELAQTRYQDNISQLDGEAYLLELEQRSESWDALGYVREIDPEFGLGQLNDSESGTRKYGIEGIYRASARLDLRGQTYKQDNLVTEASREVAELGGAVHLGRTNLRAGLKSAKDRLGNGLTQNSDLLVLGADQKVMGGRLTLKIDRDQPINGADENSDFPARTRLGADYLLTTNTTFFAEQEWSQGQDRETENTRVGIKTTPWENGNLFTTVDRENDGMAQTDSATMGLKQKWAINARWSLNLGYERGDTLSTKAIAPINTNVPFANGGSGDFSAHSLGLTYTQEEWLWTTRLENRNAATDEKNYMASSVQTQVNRDLGLLSSFTLSDADQKNGVRTMMRDLRLGMAYRPNGGPWILLDKLDLIYEKKEGVDFPARNRRIVNNLNANYRADRRWQLSFQYGAKWVRETIADQAFHSFIDLIGGEARYDINPKWDLGFRTQVLHAWKTHQSDTVYGVSVGHSFAENVWVSLGYNLKGFEDRDFSAANATSEGVFVQFRMKFDQVSIREATKWLGH